MKLDRSIARLRTLDAMRGIAAIIVVVRHLRPLIGDVAPGGYLAVDFFFALSGLVLANAYADRLQSTLGVGRFTAMRVVRLYPLYALGTLFGTAKAVLGYARGTDVSRGGGDLATTILFAALMLPSPVEAQLYPLNWPAWSLMFEVVVNVIFALVLVRLSTRMLVAVAIAAGAGLIGVAVLHGSVDLGVDWRTLDGGFCRVLFGFTIGMLFARTFRPTVRRAAWWAIVPLGLLAAMLLVPVPAGLRLAFDLLAVFAFGPLLLLLGLHVEPPQIAEWVSEWLGDVSYPLYAVHGPIVLVAISVAGKTGLPPALVAVLCIGGLLVLAAIAGKVFDARVRRWLNIRLKMPRTG